MSDETIVDGGAADPERSDLRIDRYSADVSTGSSGSGSTTKSWVGDIGGDVSVVGAVPDSDCRVHISSEGASQCTVNVENGPANSTVTVDLLVVGTPA